MTETMRRLSGARVMRAAGSLTLVHEDGRASRLEGDSAALGEAVLDFMGLPRTRGEVVAHVRALADGPFEDRVVDELLGVLLRAGAIGAVRAVEARASESAEADASAEAGDEQRVRRAVDAGAQGPRARRVRVVLGVTGAIQAVEVPRLVGLLQRRGCTVRVAATKAARRFVSFEALSALTHRPVVTGLWGGPGAPAAHIELAEWAELVVVYPASATTLSRLARGDFSDVVAAAALATRAKVMLVPSMNEGMWSAPAVQRNVELLRDDGFVVVDPAMGVEVADPPNARSLRGGAALAPERVVDLIAALAAHGAASRGGGADVYTTGAGGEGDVYTTGAGADVGGGDVYTRSAGADGGGGDVYTTGAGAPIDWDDVYTSSAGGLSWDAERVPEDLAAALAELPPPRSLVDLGTGLGAVAIHAANLGYRVVATDASRAAIALARERADDLPITFVRDDITDTRLAGAFDVAVDRGLLHVLGADELPAYSAAVSALVRPGGALLLVTDGPGAPANRATLRLAPEDLAARLPGFHLLRATRSTLAEDAPTAAWLTVWRRDDPP